MNWRCRDLTFDLTGRVLVMGIVNVTPDSFSDGGRFFSAEAAADVILLNKTDLITPDDLDDLEERLHHINAVAKIHRARNCDVPLDRVLNVGGFNLGRATELDPKFLEPEYPFEWAGAYSLPAGTHTLEIGHCDHDHGHEHGHDHADHAPAAPSVEAPHNH